MTTLRKSTINSNNFSNFSEPKVNKHYDDTPPENLAKELNTTVEALKQDNSAISFEKPQQESWFNQPEETPPPPVQSQSAEEQRAKRRQEWKESNKTMQRALQMQKEAASKLEQVKRFEQAAAIAKDNPVEIAKALGIEPSEFLRLYQNQMFNIPNEQPKLDPEEEIKQRLQKYEEERQKERQEVEQFKAQTIRNNYISAKILPVIMSDRDKFELLNLNGAESCASFIYDMMDNHYRQTGEELNALDVAEAMEEELTKEFESKIAQTRKLKKFSKHFSTDTDAPGQQVTLPGQLGENEPEPSPYPNQQLGDDSLANQMKQTLPNRKSLGIMQPPPPPVSADPSSNSYQKLASWDHKREARLSRLQNALKK